MKKTISISGNDLARRFSKRLNDVLDKLGYPASSFERARELSLAIEHDSAHMSTLLNGLLMPDWDVLLRICALSNKQPGYFLDESVTQYPPETRIAKSLDSGENIVIRLPPQASPCWGAASDNWSFLTAHDNMGFGLSRGDYVLNFAPQNGHMPVGLNSLYLLCVDEQFEVLQCSDVSNGRAVFSGSGRETHSGMPRILPLTDGNLVDESFISRSKIEHFGTIASFIRRSDMML